jgi:hypothetical protein
VDKPTVQSEDLERALKALDVLGRQIGAMTSAFVAVSSRYSEVLAIVTNAAGGIPAATNTNSVVAATRLGVDMANDIITNRPQDAGMEFDCAQALWDDRRSNGDPVLLASYLSTLREYVERGNDG